MQRMRTSLFALALVGSGLSPVWSQDADWKPAGSHAARYQDASEKPVSLLGKPIRKVDRAIEPAQFSGNVSFGTALPPAPPGPPTEYEVLPLPRAARMATAASARQTGTGQPPQPSLPGAKQAEQIPGPPPGMQGPIVNGPIYRGPIPPGQEGTFLPGWAEGGEGFGMPGCAADRYYLSAPHGAPARWYGSFDYLLWTISNDKTPPLVTTGPQESNGILGEPGVSVLNGGEIGDNTLNGGRVSLGVWFNRCQTWGMWGNFFTTQRRTDTFSASSPGDPLLARPFFNISTGQEDSELIAAEGILSGNVSIRHTSRLSGADLNFRFNLWNNYGRSRNWQHHVDLYAGFKWMSLDEGLSITEDLLAGPDSNAPGAAFLVQDHFKTDNDFYGFNLGLLNEWRWRRFFVGLRTGVAFGAIRQQVSIDGSTRITPDGEQSVTQPGGLLALPTNMGTYSRNCFSVAPELGINLGLNVTNNLRIYVGYDLMFVTNVVRPGRQIDRVVNPTQLPTVDGPGTLVGPARPAFSFKDSNLLIQGMSAGLQWVY